MKPRNFPTGFRSLLFPLVVNLIVSDLMAAAPPPSAQAADRPPIRSAAEIDYPPFSYAGPDGRATGFSVELLRAALGAMGREVTFKTGPWAGVRGWLEKGDIDALPLVGRTPERERLFDFTVPYMTLYGAIVVRKGDVGGVWDIKDLKGRTVAVMEGDNAEEFLRREDRGVHLLTTPSFTEAFQLLSQGRCDAVVVQRLVALRLMRETGISGLHIVNRPIEKFRQAFCFAVTEGDRDTLALLNEGLALVTADGTYRHLHAKWFASLELPEHRRIVIGGDHNFPPFEFLDENGRPAGFNVDLTRAIARETGMEIEIRLGPWSKIREDLTAGKIDAIQGMFYSPERDKTYDFTPSHIVNHCVAVVRKGSAAPGGVKELAGLAIVVQEGDIMHDFALENNLGDRVFTADAQEDALRELADGRHDCALVSRMTAFYWIKKYGWDNLEVGDRPLMSPAYCFAVPNNNQALLAQFSEGFKMVNQAGEYRRIYEKWMGGYEPLAPDFFMILRYAAFVIVPLTMLLLGFLLWNRALRKQVMIRTEALRRSEEEYRNLFENAPIGIFRTSSQGKPLLVNTTLARLLGADSSQAAVNYYSDLGTQLYVRPERREAFLHLLREKGTVEDFEYEAKTIDGRWLWLIMNASVKENQQDGSFFIEGFTFDISGRKQAAEALKKSEEQYRLLADNTLDAIWTLNMDLVFTYINPACFAMTGYTREEWIGSRLQDHCDEANFQIMAENVMKGLEGGPEFPGVIFEAEMIKKNGEPFPVEIHGKIIFNAAGQPVMIQGVTRDITERKKLQNQLIQAQKMESVGRLAGGVAHDFNNMLSVILGYSELVLEKIPEENSLHEDVREIQEAGRRAADVTRQLLAFARRQTIAPKILDLNEKVDGMLKMLRRLIGEDIDLAWHPRPGLWPVKLDPAQIDQILVNLGINAKDAISDIGKITIETDRVSIDNEYCADHSGFVPGDFVVLAVTDNGCGMDAETVEKIYEPFFTTKAVGQGTGLGLPTVYGIMKQNNGFINVYSEPGSGTTFKLYFPRHTEALAPVAVPEIEKIPEGAGETVLVVEDDAMILVMAEKMLSNFGYHTLAASCPAEALKLAAAHEGDIDLVMTDVIMPVMNGRELSEKLRELYPDLRVLFMSGYTANVIAHHGVLEDGVHFIQKPFSRHDLAVRVRQALSE